MSKSLRVAVRLTEKDGDILLLVSKYRPSVLLSIAVRRYLGDMKAVIPIEPYEPQAPRILTITINQKTTPEAYRLFLSIPNGSRSAAVKLLIRHAMPECDLRFLLGQTEQSLTKRQDLPPKKPRPQREPSKPEAKPAAASRTKRETNPPQTGGDDIFGLI